MMYFLIITLFLSGFDIVLADNTNYTQLVDVYPSSFKCGDDLHSSLSGVLKLLLVNDGIEKVYVNNGIKFSPPHKSSKISDKCHNNFNPNSELLDQLEEISQFINIFNSAFSNCYHVFKENSSAPSGYYMIRATNGSLISVYCDLSFVNCSQILHVNSFAPSGYYTIQAPNGSLISVYCDMEGSNCDGKGGWMRVGYLNMSEPGATCPPGLTLHQYNNIDHGLCSRPVSSSGSSASVFFSTYGVIYNKVCGRVIGYQYGSTDAFPPNLGGGHLYNPNVDNIYVDGVSITYDNNPRKHVWTLGVGNVADDTSVNQHNCPCNTGNTETTVPSFVGSDYYCESGVDIGYWSSVLYANDPLWDGQQCGGLEGPCCTNPKMPWFIKILNETTTEDIELRVMADEATSNEDIPLDIIELYIR